MKNLKLLICLFLLQVSCAKSPLTETLSVNPEMLKGTLLAPLSFTMSYPKGITLKGPSGKNYESFEFRQDDKLIWSLSVGYLKGKGNALQGSEAFDDAVLEPTLKSLMESFRGVFQTVKTLEYKKQKWLGKETHLVLGEGHIKVDSLKLDDDLFMSIHPVLPPEGQSDGLLLITFQIKTPEIQSLKDFEQKSLPILMSGTFKWGSQ
jgi:hypothetical protein